MAGWVYVIRNPAMPKLVKVGFTELGARAHAHIMTAREGVPDPYDVAFRLFVEHPRDVEKRCHLLLRENRYRKEWFRCSVKRAAEAIKQVASTPRRHAADPDSPLVPGHGSPSQP
jgi:hypothetical protein